MILVIKMDENKYFKNTLSNYPNSIIKDNGIFVTAVGHYKQKPVSKPFERDYLACYQMFYTVSGKGFAIYEGKKYNLTEETVACFDLRKHHVID